jgi:hypothetical protein
MATSIMMRAFWDIAWCSQGDHPDYTTTLMMEAVCTSETSVNSNETTQHYIPEGSHLQILICFICVFVSTADVSGDSEWPQRMKLTQSIL